MCFWPCGLLFLSTLSLRRATAVGDAFGADGPYFYPRSPCGERRWMYRIFCLRFYFYPRSPCGERPTDRWCYQCMILISIHALLAESDRFPSSIWSLTNNFYPRSPCGERPRRRVVPRAALDISIHALLAESDAGISSSIIALINFYPRSPCGERP